MTDGAGCARGPRISRRNNLDRVSLLLPRPLRHKDRARGETLANPRSHLFSSPPQFLSCSRLSRPPAAAASSLSPALRPHHRGDRVSKPHLRGQVGEQGRRGRSSLTGLALDSARVDSFTGKPSSSSQSIAPLSRLSLTFPHYPQIEPRVSHGGCCMRDGAAS